MSKLEKLTEHFRHFPGIGPRQAKRFVYFLLSHNKTYLEEIAKLILEIKSETKICKSCFRFFTINGRDLNQCKICSNEERDHSSLLVVEKDVDFENIEKSGAYKGVYFVLGGSVPILEKEPEKKVRSRELLERIKKDREKNGLSEVVLAFSVNADGENTKDYIEGLLSPLIDKGLKISTLGRGLSSGSELEYVDSETIKNALSNRH